MRNRYTLFGLALAGTLGACNRHSEPPPENQPVETPAPVTQTVVAAPETPPAPTPKPVKPKAKAAPKPSADEQMLDDADATGMTSHPTSDADTSGQAGNSQP